MALVDRDTHLLVCTRYLSKRKICPIILNMNMNFIVINNPNFNFKAVPVAVTVMQAVKLVQVLEEADWVMAEVNFH